MMDKDRSHMTERIVNLTLEIIYLLTGEDYTVVKKTSGDCVTPSSRLRVSGGVSQTQSPNTVPPPHSLIHERDNDQKILELTNKIIQLLTGEEGQYIKQHTTPCSDATIEISANQIPTSLGTSSNGNEPGRCSHPPYSTERILHIPPDYQEGNLIDVKVEEMHVSCDQQCKEKAIPVAIIADLSSDQNTPEICLHPIYSQEHDSYSQKEDEGLKIVIFEIDQENNHGKDIYVEIKEEEIPTAIGTDCEIMRNDSNQGLQMGSDVTSYVHTDTAPSSAGESLNKQLCLESDRPVSAAQQPNVCSECGECFPCSAALSKHQECHSGKTMHECADCGQSFACRTGLRKHHCIHMRERPFGCGKCGKSFHCRANLVAHQRIHTQEKPFSCPLCGKSFRCRGNLVAHQQIHTQEKPFSCPQCGKSFKQKSNQVIHERIHWKEKPFSCSECGKCFVKKSNLVMHQRVHNGDRPYN